MKITKEDLSRMLLVEHLNTLEEIKRTFESDYLIIDKFNKKMVLAFISGYIESFKKINNL